MAEPPGRNAQSVIRLAEEEQKEEAEEVRSADRTFSNNLTTDDDVFEEDLEYKDQMRSFLKDERSQQQPGARQVQNTGPKSEKLEFLAVSDLECKDQVRSEEERQQQRKQPVIARQVGRRGEASGRSHQRDQQRAAPATAFKQDDQAPSVATVEPASVTASAATAKASNRTTTKMNTRSSSNDDPVSSCVMLQVDSDLEAQRLRQEIHQEPNDDPPPVAAEVMLEPPSINSSRRRRRKTCIYRFLLALVPVVIAIIVGVAVVVSSSRSNDRGENDTATSPAYMSPTDSAPRTPAPTTPSP